MKMKRLVSIMLGLVSVIAFSFSLNTFKANASTSYVLELKPNYFSEELWCYGDDEYKPLISKNDVKVYSGTELVDNNSVVVSAKKPSETTFTVLTADFNDFNAYGEYFFKYYVETSSAVDSNVIERKITVIDAVAPTFSVYDDAEIVGAIKKSNGTDKLKYFKALKGKELKIATVYASDASGVVADLTNAITISATFNGETAVDVETAYSTDKYDFKFTPNASGVYSIEYTVTDGFNTTKLNYFIDVRDSWIEITNDLVIDSVVNSGTSISVSEINVVDFYGNKKACNAKATLYYGEEELANGSTNFSYDLKKSGDYKLVLTAENAGENADSKVYEFTVVDKSAPTFNVSGTIVEEVLLGEEIVLPTVAVVDNNDVVIGYVLEITVDGKTVNYFENKFTPIKEGEYVVKYYATDIAGNYGEYTFTIKVVTDNAFNGLNIALIIIAGVALVGAILVWIFVKKKKSTAKLDEEVETVEVETVEE